MGTIDSAPIVIVGASGLIGGLLLPLLGSHDRIAIGRRSIEGIARQAVGPVETWPELVADTQPHVAISTLGTTIRDAGSQSAFFVIDHDAVIGFARAAKAAGARQLIIVTSVGADPQSSNFYLRTKGQTEKSARAIGFDRIDILRPGLLKGKRPGVARPSEQVLSALSPITDALTPQCFDHYRSIPASTVATAIAQLVDAREPGCFIHHNREMLALAANRP